MMSDETPFFLRKRFYVMICVMVSSILSNWYKTNLSIFLVNMTSNKTIIASNSVTFVEEVEFHWSSIDKGVILSSFFFGFIFSPVGGIIAPRWGGIRTFTYSSLSTALLMTVSPLLLKQHFLLYLLQRFFAGFFEGITAASFGEILIQWAPPDERTFLSSIGAMGLPLGYIVTYPIAGHVNENYDWDTTFYITGGTGIFWSVVCFVLLAEKPSKDKFMKKVEKEYLRKVNKTTLDEKMVHPWREIIISGPFWALLNEWFIESWSVSMIGACLPLYITDVYEVNMEELVWLSSVPHYFSVIGRIPAAGLADYLISNGTYSKTKIHKILILTAQISSLLCLIIVGITNHFLFSVVALGVLQMCFSVAFVSSYVLPLEIGARHGSFILGLCTTVSSIGFMLNPLMIGLMVPNHTFTEWSKYFFAMSLFNAWAAVIFAVYGSAELQPWAKPIEQRAENILLT